MEHPPEFAAANFVPSADDVMEFQFAEITERLLQLSPEFVDVWIFPLLTTAANFVPSADDVIEIQFWEPDGRAVQISPADNRGSEKLGAVFGVT